jgi:hypothetical protein
LVSRGRAGVLSASPALFPETEYCLYGIISSSSKPRYLLVLKMVIKPQLRIFVDFRNQGRGWDKTKKLRRNKGEQ